MARNTASSAKHQVISRKNEQDNCFIIQHVDNKHSFIAVKLDSRNYVYIAEYLLCTKRRILTTS